MREIRLWTSPHLMLGLFQRRRGVCLGVSVHWGRRKTLQIDLLLLIIQVTWLG